MTPPDLSPAGIEVQLQVQRHLGRCLMRIQQYEQMAKTLVAHSDIAGPAKQLLKIQNKRIKKASNASLGNLVQRTDLDFTNLRTLFSAVGTEPNLLDESKPPTDQVSFAIRFRIQMTEEQRAETLRALDAFVNLRNRLVHHFMDDFDIFSDGGCTKALQHLHDSYAEIDKQYNTLRPHLMQLDETRQRVAAFMQTPEYLDLLTGEAAEFPKEIRF
jgi:hypothetical protein